MNLCDRVRRLEAERTELLALLADAAARVELLEAAIEGVVALHLETPPAQWELRQNAVLRLQAALEEGTDEAQHYRAVSR